jgi:hypothetical protein
MATPAKKGKSPKPERAKGTKPQHPAGKEFTAYSSSTPQARADKTKEEARKKKIKDEFSHKWSEPQFFHKFGNDPTLKRPKKK